MVGTNRAFRDVLLLKGYSVTYNEVNGGHDDIWWRGSFADGLLTLIGSRPTEVNKHQRNPRINTFRPTLVSAPRHRYISISHEATELFADMRHHCWLPLTLTLQLFKYCWPLLFPQEHLP